MGTNYNYTVDITNIPTLTIGTLSIKIFKIASIGQYSFYIGDIVLVYSGTTFVRIVNTYLSNTGYLATISYTTANSTLSHNSSLWILIKVNSFNQIVLTAIPQGSGVTTDALFVYYWLRSNCPSYFIIFEILITYLIILITKTKNKVFYVDIVIMPEPYNTFIIHGITMISILLTLSKLWYILIYFYPNI